MAVAYQRALKIGYSSRTIRWSLDIDVEGDRFNEIAYTDVAANPDFDLPSLKPPSYIVETGHLSPVWLKAEQSGPLASLRPIKNEARRVEFAVDFARTPTQADPASFTLESYDYNASSLDAVEFRRKFPKRAILREWEEKSIEEPVDDFAWTLRFPRELRFERPPEFEVVDTRTAERHEWLTRVLTPSFYYSEPLHTAILAIHRPPAGYLYRIYWYIAARGPTEPAIDPKHQLQADGFRKKLLAINEAILDHQTPPPIHAEVRRVLQAFAKCVEEKIAHLAGTASYLQARDLDVSLMVYDKYRGDDVPVLRIVSCIGPEAHRHWPFTLEVGDGNAGRAFKKNIIRSWDALSSDPHQTYILQAGLPPHSIIYSIPMRHPPPVSQDLIYGILNLGAHTAPPAGPLRLLNDKAGIEWLTDTAQEYVLKRLFDIV